MHSLARFIHHPRTPHRSGSAGLPGASVDLRGCRISGATPAALEAFERALAAMQGWQAGAEAHLDAARAEAPGFVMAHALQAWMQLCSRDPRRALEARAVHARAAGLRADAREQAHLDAIGIGLDGDFEGVRTRLGSVLRQHPRDAVALQVAHAFDYFVGDANAMIERVSAVRGAWSRDLPGYQAVLAMHAFAFEENGEYGRAEQTALESLAMNPLDTRSHHVMAHVFEMTDRPEAGVAWLDRHAPQWAAEGASTTHVWWHLALFHLALGRVDRVLALYDQRVRDGRSHDLAELIDAAALLWRVHLCGIDAGPRWGELARAWMAHIDDAYCSFNDLHAMLAFVGARDWDSAQRLERRLAAAQSLPTRHGVSTRELGLPVCRALIAYGRGNHKLAVTLLASLPEFAHRLGGSHAQRDVLHLTLLSAIERIRRPARRGEMPGMRPRALQ